MMVRTAADYGRLAERALMKAGGHLSATRDRRAASGIPTEAASFFGLPRSCAECDESVSKPLSSPSTNRSAGSRARARKPSRKCRAIARAATMVRSGDRAIVLTILGAVAAAGRLMTKAVGRQRPAPHPPRREDSAACCALFCRLLPPITSEQIGARVATHCSACKGPEIDR
jgi:hypothetical protein